MVFSPDFLLYFAQLAHLFEDDPSIYCITSWNDNGKQGVRLSAQLPHPSSESL